MTVPATAVAIDERQRENAAHAFDLALRLCVDCQQYHALRPYLRLTKETAGVRSDFAAMEARLATLIAEGRRRVLVVGAGDFGIASLALSAARGTPIALTVIDRCATPLVVIQELSAQHGFRVRTLQADLTDFHLPGAFDLVVGHHVLPFIQADKRPAMLRCVARCLAPGGRFFIAVRDPAWRRWRDTRFAGPEDSYEKRFLDRVWGDLAEARVEPPPQRAIFERHLREHAAIRKERVRRYDDLDALRETFARVGLTIVEERASQDERRLEGMDMTIRPDSSGVYITARAANDAA